MKPEQAAKMIFSILPGKKTYDIRVIKDMGVRLLVKDMMTRDKWREIEPNVFQRCGIISVSYTIYVEEINGKFFPCKRIDNVMSWLDGNRRAIGDSWVESQVEILNEEGNDKYTTALVQARVIERQMKKK